MGIKYSRHALFRIRVRGVSKRQIALTIRDPDSAYLDLESDATVAVRQFSTRYLVVFSDTRGSDTRIVTVYYASDVSSLISRKLRRGAWVLKK